MPSRPSLMGFLLSDGLSLFSSALQQEKDRGGEKCISFRTMVGTVFGEKRSCPDKVII
jgi:hypothetical protein